MLNKTVLSEHKPPPMPHFQQKVIWDSNPDFRIRMSAGSLTKCGGFITLSASVISPSFIKLEGDCMRNANKYPKMPYSAVVRKMENWYKIRIWDHSPTKSLPVFPADMPNHSIKFQWNRLITFSVILLTKWRTDTQKERSHNLRLVGGREHLPTGNESSLSATVIHNNDW